jgi:multidrug resistance efflux pump
LGELQHELHLANLKIVESDRFTIHRLQAIENYLDGLREDLERARGDARKAHAALAVAEHERSQLSVRLLSASVKLENARLREAQWICHRDAISVSQQEEFAIESWFLRLR